MSPAFPLPASSFLLDLLHDSRWSPDSSMTVEHSHPFVTVAPAEAWWKDGANGQVAPPPFALLDQVRDKEAANSWRRLSSSDVGSSGFWNQRSTPAGPQPRSNSSGELPVTAKMRRPE